MSFSVRYEEDPLLRPHALNFVVLDDKFLLEDLDRIKPPGPLRLGQHDLAEVTLAQNCKEVEVIETNALASSGIGRQG